jgi:pseudaminic acid cytidylyltransferase
MIAWSIAAAKAANVFQNILVSTDDSEIAELAIHYGAEVPFVRPQELSNDYAGTIPVIAHAADWCMQEFGNVSNVCCVYATAPFVQSDDIVGALELLAKDDVDYVFSVTSYPFPIQRAIKVTESKRIEMFQPEHFNTRSQDLEEAFHDAGQFYWGRTNAWIDGKVIFGPSSSPYIIPRHRVQDIDTPEDWTRAEWLFKALKESVSE